MSLTAIEHKSFLEQISSTKFQVKVPFICPIYLWPFQAIFSILILVWPKESKYCRAGTIKNIICDILTVFWSANETPSSASSIINNFASPITFLFYNNSPIEVPALQYFVKIIMSNRKLLFNTALEREFCLKEGLF